MTTDRVTMTTHSSRSPLPLVAVVGRPNVGKSALVNRIVGSRVAIVEDTPGVTRDRHVLEAQWSGVSFSIVDTGGWIASAKDMDAKVAAQAEVAIKEADIVLFVVDVTVGITAEDAEVASMLQRSDKEILVVGNKVDSGTRESDLWEFMSLGLGVPLGVSALHGRGSGDLLDEVVAKIASLGERSTPGDADSQDSQPKIAAVALVGRPNVGKSTLFNRLVGEERSVVHDLAGTTTDTVDTVVETDAGTLRILDTAGMRRHVKSAQGTEYYSMVRALRAVDAADVVLLIIDAEEGVTHQDQRLAERIDAAGSPIVIVANKWDRLDTEGRLAARAAIEDRLGFLSYAPIVAISALSGRNVSKLIPAVAASLGASARRMPTGELNSVVQAAQRAHPAPGSRILYATQGAIEPPTITIFATRELDRSWLRYLERVLREHFALGPTPLDIRVRRRDATKRSRASR